MKQLINKHEKKVRYLIVGGWNTAFGYAVFVLLFLFLKNYLHYIAISAISQIIGITNAYIGYKIFVFKTRGNYSREYFRFYLVYGFSFILSLALLPLFVELLKIHPLISQIFIILIIVIISFVGHKHFSFRVSTNSNNGV